MKILPGLTSTRRETMAPFLDDLLSTGIREIALFPTCLGPEQRSRLYRDLELIPGLKAPHVHLRHDMAEGELEYLRDRFGAILFNLHPASSEHVCVIEDPGLRSMTYVENVSFPPGEDDLRRYAGLCLDFSHWENARVLGRAAYAGFDMMCHSHPVGCCHISAIRIGEPNRDNGGWDHHCYKHLSNFDYLMRYARFAPDGYLSLELENSLGEQLRAAAYVERLLVAHREGRGYTLSPEGFYLGENAQG